MKARLIRICCCLLLFSGASGVYAQQIVAKGVVMDRFSKNRIVIASITNLRTGDAVGSNDMGFFQISAAVGDSLLIEKRNYAAVKVHVASEKDIVVNLYPTVTNINQVAIGAQSKKAQLDEMRQDYKNKGVFYGGKPPILAYVFHPLTAIYELFGSEPKNARRFGRYYVNEMQQTKVDGFFNEYLIKQHTTLDGKALNQFMLDYRPDYKIAEKWNTYDAIKYIQESYKKYSDTAKKSP